MMLRSSLVTALAFAIVGPLVGTLGFAVLGWREGASDPGAAALGILWLLPFGYILGGLPAALTGAVVGLVGARAPGVLFVLSGMAITAAAAAAMGQFAGEGPVLGDGVLNLALIGAAAGLLWVRDGGQARRLAAYGVSLAGGCALGFLLFASYANRAPVCDALSPVWTSILILASGVLLLLSLLPLRGW